METSDIGSMKMIPDTQVAEGFDFQEAYIKLEKILIQVISILLIAHGIWSLYQETLQIFFVYPNLPDIFKSAGYSQDIYQALYRRTILVSSTAALETIYGLALVSKLKYLVRKLHIFSGTALVLIAFIINNQTKTLTDYNLNNQLNEKPSLDNIFKLETILKPEP